MNSLEALSIIANDTNYQDKTNDFETNLSMFPKEFKQIREDLEELEQIKTDKDRSKIEYKGYYAYPYYSAEDKLFVGKVENTTDLAMFQGSTVDEMIKDFQEAVEMLIELEGN